MMNIIQKFTRRFIGMSFSLSVWIIEHFSKMEEYHKQVDEIRKLENGTLGKEIADCLDKHNLTLVPKYESHDLKHVLLDFKMTAEDEIRMQAFMIGNGNYSIPSFTIFIFGAVLLPELWPKFYSDFKNGRNTIPISKWTIEKYSSKSINDLRVEIAEPKKNLVNISDMKRLTKYAALVTVLAGVLGMIFCLPFLFSSNLADLIGAGFPFLGGAILVVGGLLTLSNLTENKINISR